MQPQSLYIQFGNNTKQNALKHIKHYVKIVMWYMPFDGAISIRFQISNFIPISNLKYKNHKSNIV